MGTIYVKSVKIICRFTVPCFILRFSASTLWWNCSVHFTLSLQAKWWNWLGLFRIFPSEVEHPSLGFTNFHFTSEFFSFKMDMHMSPSTAACPPWNPNSVFFFYSLTVTELAVNLPWDSRFKPVLGRLATGSCSWTYSGSLCSAVFSKSFFTEIKRRRTAGTEQH